MKKSTSKPNRSINNRFRPSLEMLECRLVPAATAVLTAGALVFTGDVNANEIHIQQDAQDRIIITSPDTVINGQAVNTPILFKVTKTTTLNMGAGNDKIFFDSATSFNNEIDLPSSLIINGGTGDNLVEFGGGASKGTVINGGLNITNAAGFDTLTIHDSLFVQTNMVVNNGDGNGGLGANSSLIQGDNTTSIRTLNLVVSNGKGRDEINLADALSFEVAALIINNNSTMGDIVNSVVEISPSGKFTAASVTYTGSAGLDEVYLGSDNDQAIVSGAVNINGTSGGSRVDLFGQQGLSLGSLTVTNTTSNAELFVGGKHGVAVGFGNNVTIAGAVTVNNAGNTAGNRTFLGEGATNNLYIGGPIKVTGGTGSDTTFIGVANDGTTVTPTVNVGAITVANGAGPSSDTRVVGGTLSVRGQLNVSSTSPLNDDVTIRSTTTSGLVTGGVNLALGAGAGQNVVISADTAGTQMSIGMALVISQIDPKILDGATSTTLLGVRVGGTTTITSGNSDDIVTIDDSYFLGLVSMNTGGGDDTVNIEQATGTLTSTRFRNGFSLFTGAGDDDVHVGVSGDDTCLVIFGNGATFNGGADGDSLALTTGGNTLLNGGTITKSLFETGN